MSKKLIAVNTVILLLILCGILWIGSMFIHVGYHPYTDNAQVHRDMVPVHSRVQGFVKEVRFEEFSRVEKGDTLLIIEDAEYRLRLAQAEANYQHALTAKSAMGTMIRTTQNNIEVAGSTLAEIEVQLRLAERNYRRYESLLAAQSVTRQEFDSVKAHYEALQAKYETIVRQQQSTVLVKTEQSQRVGQNDAQIAVARAALELAKLNLSYTVITAPCSGYTTCKHVNEGEMMQIGRSVISIVSDEQCWVVANYRERQMRSIEVGAEVEIRVDAIADYTFKGCVEAISDATASEYSPVKQSNAAGNFVKVEQRVPIKIRFTEENDAARLRQLRSGLNVECRVMRK